MAKNNIYLKEIGSHKPNENSEALRTKETTIEGKKIQQKRQWQKGKTQQKKDSKKRDENCWVILKEKIEKQEENERDYPKTYNTK